MAARARAAGLAATEFEIRHGSAGDVLRGPVRAKIRASIRGRRTAGVMLATPCTSFTTARNRTRGPIRSRRYPRGLYMYSWGERLREVDKSALRQGNTLLDVTISVLRDCNLTGTPACLENPRGSYLWHDRKLRRELRLGGVKYVTIDQCFYGQPWKKTTTLAFINCDDAEFGTLTKARCTGKRGWCDFNKDWHVQLSGDPRYARVAPAEQAQAFPPRLAQAIVHTLLIRERSHLNYVRFRESLGLTSSL